MARYYFDLMHADGMTTDEAGVEFLSRGEMRTGAIVALHDIARDEVGPHDHQTVAVKYGMLLASTYFVPQSP
jgi:hypothetical protein